MSKLYEKFKDYTMVDERTFDANIDLINMFSDVDGCVVECGVWKGGMIAGIASVLGDKQYYLFDSFEGLPEAHIIDGRDAQIWQRNTPDNCKAEMHYAMDAMEKSGASEYHIVPGWFNDTTPIFDKPIAILRLDGDWYFSTLACLVNLYDKVVSGGLIIIDDFFAWEGCRKATMTFFTSRDVVLHMNINSGLCWMVKP